MKKYLIFLMVFVLWCTGFPFATNYICVNYPVMLNEPSEQDESTIDEKTQEVTSDNSNTSTNVDMSEETSQDISVDVSNDISENISDIEGDASSIETENETVVRVYNHKTDEIFEMKLEEYIVGAVYAEMPSSFEFEALKAQAVAVRSYILYNIQNGTREAGHPGADVCTDPSHCKAYTTIEKVAEKYGEVFAEESFNIIKQAVKATENQVMTYDGEVINAVFHASSSGFTESCVDVWGGELPYLVSVSTPDESGFYSFYGKVTLSENEFKSKFNSYNCDFSGTIYNWIQNIKTNSIGRLESCVIGGVTISGNELRALIGLKSTTIKITINTDNIVFETEGYGHGVGMSQYGANMMAEAGSDYTEILKHYYSGIKIEKLEE